MNKNVIITGTSRGIGLELVKLFAAQGNKVLALSRNDKPVKQLNLSNVHTFSFDLINQNDYNKVKEFITSEWEQVDILINNSGVLINKPFAETSIDDFTSVDKNGNYIAKCFFEVFKDRDILFFDTYSNGQTYRIFNN